MLPKFSLRFSLNTRGQSNELPRNINDVRVSVLSKCNEVFVDRTC
jgi:hypothetical protein